MAHTKKICMKQLLYTLLFVLLFHITSRGQAIELTPSYGYQLGTKLNYGPNFLRFDDGDQLGIVLGVETANELMAELTYIRQNADLTIRDVVLSPQETYLADLTADWFQLGGTQYFGNDNLKPFFGGGLGLVVFSPNDENFDIVTRSLSNETIFSFHLKGGINIMFNDIIGINLQGSLLFPVNWGGFFVGVGPGGPSGGVSVSSTTVIGAFSGGLVFRFDK